jgi:hypothetical protein
VRPRTDRERCEGLCFSHFGKAEERAINGTGPLRGLTLEGAGGSDGLELKLNSTGETCRSSRAT